MEYSVLMSVYAKEEPVYLDTAIQSMLDQTVRTDDFVIVCDGPLTAELDAVLERHLAQNPAVLHLVRLPHSMLQTAHYERFPLILHLILLNYTESLFHHY